MNKTLAPQIVLVHGLHHSSSNQRETAKEYRSDRLAEFSIYNHTCSFLPLLWTWVGFGVGDESHLEVIHAFLLSIG